MQGTGVPVVTPFEADGTVDEEALGEVVSWLEDRGVDFLVPCGSTGEAPLLGNEEAARVIEVVADAAEGPVLAGTGRESYVETRRATERAASAGADAALVVTPSYYSIDEETLETYYLELADESPIPIYLYSVPKFTGVTIAPETVGAVAGHPNVAGIKDSAGELAPFQRTRGLAEGIDVLVGHGGVYAPALDAGADGGILAVGNVAPEISSEIYERHSEGDDEGARELNRRLLELNEAVTARYGVAGAKAAMGLRGVSAGNARRPLRGIDDGAEEELRALLADLELL